MGKLKLWIIVASFLLTIGATSILLYLVRHDRLTQTIPPVSFSIPKRPNLPPGWQKIDVDGKFAFYLPPDMREMEPEGNIDYVGPSKTFANRALEVNYSYIEKRNNDEIYRGRISCEKPAPDETALPAYRSAELEISQRKTTQVFWEDEPGLSVTTVCIPDAGDGTLLHFGAMANDKRGVELATQIFSLIDLPESQLPTK